MSRLYITRILSLVKKYILIILISVFLVAFYIFFYIEITSHHPVKHYIKEENIVFAVQGKQENLLKFYYIFINSTSIYKPNLLVLGYIKYPIQYNIFKSNDKVIELNLSGTTWTTGRNMMAFHIKQYEEENNCVFKYQVYSDQDIDLVCNYTEEIDCWNYYWYILNHVNVPIVAPNYIPKNKISAHKNDKGLYLVDSIDAGLNAFHRYSVPLFLPYHSELDSLSWWESQAILFHIQSGCLPHGVLLINNLLWINNGHTGYPAGRAYDKELNLIHTLFTNLIPYPITGVIPNPLPHNFTGPFNIRDIKLTTTVWTMTDRFIKCLSMF